MKENNLNNDEAFEQCKKAAEQGDASAQNALGDIFRYGSDVVQKDAAEAIKWYKKAAEQLYDYALNNLGDCYYYGEGVEQDYVKAAKWYKQAAERGNEYAPDNLELLIQKLDNAAEQGDASAQYTLGVCCANGYGVERNEEVARKLFLMAAEHGDAMAQWRLGHDHFTKGNYAEAVKWLTLSAEHGCVFAQSTLAYMYNEGKGVKENETEALKWYTKAAEQGDNWAQQLLGNYYLERHDYQEAAKWYREAVRWLTEMANDEETDALHHLADCYYEGNGGEQDFTKATQSYVETINMSIEKINRHSRELFEQDHQDDDPQYWLESY